jgi:hypothetical protein
MNTLFDADKNVMAYPPFIAKKRNLLLRIRSSRNQILKQEVSMNGLDDIRLQEFCQFPVVVRLFAEPCGPGHLLPEVLASNSKVT